MTALLSLRAHTPNSDGEWHDLADHTRAVTEAAAAFAATFDAADLARWAGVLHDLGKSSLAFQAYLADCDRAKRTGTRPPKPGLAPHAIWGAALAQTLQKAWGELWADVAVPVAGHHAGIKAPKAIQQEIGLLDDPVTLQECLGVLARFGPPTRSPEPIPADPSEREMRIRFVLSALADADFTDTERHFNADRWAERGRHDSVSDLADRAAEKHRRFVGGLAEPDSAINTLRREVYDACIERAADPTGFFRLTVPTGGGKTLSGLAFALEHARANDLDRVVVAIPYTSIIDQTAAVYADLLGSPNVLVHHSQTPEPPNAGAEDAVGPSPPAPASEPRTWDVPVVVTTTVQLFESLFSPPTTSRVRKLHRLIARSVIVLDEVQALPPGVLDADPRRAPKTARPDWGATRRVLVGHPARTPSTWRLSGRCRGENGDGDRPEPPGPLAQTAGAGSGTSRRLTPTSWARAGGRDRVEAARRRFSSSSTRKPRRDCAWSERSRSRRVEELAPPLDASCAGAHRQVRCSGVVRQRLEGWRSPSG